MCDAEDQYNFTTNVCKRLSKVLNIDKMKFEDGSNYEPPKEHGLTNCNVIIPQYYHLHKDFSKVFDIDYYNMIKDDIRNMRPLNEYQIKYMKELPDEYKNELFDLFNDCFTLIDDLLK